MIIECDKRGTIGIEAIFRLSDTRLWSNLHEGLVLKASVTSPFAKSWENSPKRPE